MRTTTALNRQNRADDSVRREQLSNLQGLMMLSMLMTETADEGQILDLAATSLPSFGRCRMEGVYLIDGGWRMTMESCPREKVRAGIEAQFGTLGRNGGAITIPGEAWGWAFPLGGLRGRHGYFIVGATYVPPQTEMFLLQVLAQQAGVAFANARLHASERAAVADLRAANEALAESVHALERKTQIHVRFTKVAMAGGGEVGIAQTLHDLTGFPVAIEDRYGNLRAWAGPNRPDPYPKDPPVRREQMLRRALREGRPTRECGRLLTVANPRHDALGVLALIDPAAAAGDEEEIALEHGATVLAMELAHLQSVADAELRLRRDLVEELLVGTDEEGALARARALGHDLQRPYRVVVVEGRGRIRSEDAFLHAVRHQARDIGVGSLLVARGGTVVLLADTEVGWERLRGAVLTELGGGRCRIGVGGVCERPGHFPRSYREALCALKMHQTARGPDRAICYDALGVYRILSEVQHPAALESFVRQWLGPLLDYDARKHSELVLTLGQYLECGGNYDATAATLSVHRSTLKYRLQRIREITGRDLGDPDTHFNLQLATRTWQTLQALRSLLRSAPMLRLGGAEQLLLVNRAGRDGMGRETYVRLMECLTLTFSVVMLPPPVPQLRLSVNGRPLRELPIRPSLRGHGPPPDRRAARPDGAHQARRGRTGGHRRRARWPAWLVACSRRCPNQRDRPEPGADHGGLCSRRGLAGEGRTSTLPGRGRVRSFALPRRRNSRA